ncbi:YtpI family protein [Bacillota bacterium Lsc_1132]
MPVLVFAIIISLAFYIFYKMKYVRSRHPAEKKWLSAKSSIALGLFVLLFGINQLFLHQTPITYVVAGIFILIGGMSFLAGIKAYKYYLPYAVKEAESLKEQ